MSEPAPYRPQLRRRRKPTTVLIASIVGVLITGLMLWWAVRLASKNPEIANLEAGVFSFDAEDLADEIGDRGPFLLKDPLNRGREVYIQHTGATPKSGWHAISAYASRSDLDCLLGWDATRKVFVDPCDRKTFPADGEGLSRYPVEVVDGRVEVDLTAQPSGRAP
ncbi:MAG: hypothetical protein ACLGI2_03250 [Acidimicrobiia bacterium]